MITTMKRALVGTAAAVCFATGFGANAAGVFYQSDFDPIGFAGSAKWYVDQNCFSVGSLFQDPVQPVSKPDTGYQFVNVLGPGCTVSLYSLTVRLWNGDPDNNSSNGIKYPDLASAAQNAADSQLLELIYPSEYPNPGLVLGVHVVDGYLAGVDSLLYGPQCNTSDLTKMTGCYGVQFTSGESPLAPLGQLLSGTALGNLDEKGAYLWKQWTPRFFTCAMNAFFWCAGEVTDLLAGEGDGFATFDTPGTTNGFRFLGTSPDGPTVPEPTSLVLLGGALVASWLTRRRKNA
jgi:hypothetical protein